MEHQDEEEAVALHKFMDNGNEDEIEREIKGALIDWSLVDNDSPPLEASPLEWRARYETELDRNLFKHFKANAARSMRLRETAELEREMLLGQKDFLDYFKKNTKFVEQHRVNIPNLERSTQNHERNLKAKERAKERKFLISQPIQQPILLRRLSPSPKASFPG